MNVQHLLESSDDPFYVLAKLFYNLMRSPEESLDTHELKDSLPSPFKTSFE